MGPFTNWCGADRHPFGWSMVQLLTQRAAGIKRSEATRGRGATAPNVLACATVAHPDTRTNGRIDHRPDGAGPTIRPIPRQWARDAEHYRNRPETGDSERDTARRYPRDLSTGHRENHASVPPVSASRPAPLSPSPSVPLRDSQTAAERSAGRDRSTLCNAELSIERCDIMRTRQRRSAMDRLTI